MDKSAATFPLELHQQQQISDEYSTSENYHSDHIYKSSTALLLNPATLSINESTNNKHLTENALIGQGLLDFGHFYHDQSSFLQQQYYTSYDPHVTKIKDGTPHKLSETAINSPPNSTIKGPNLSSAISKEQRQCSDYHIFSSGGGGHFTEHELEVAAAELLFDAQRIQSHERGYNLNHVIPSTKYISALDHLSFPLVPSGSLGLNSQTLDLFSSTSYSRISSSESRSSSYDHRNTFGLGSSPIGQNNVQSRKHRSSNTVLSEVVCGVPRTKRPGSSTNSEPKESYHAENNKKSRPSCPPLKVRKEKLGDRIAALQRLVAPFGKTDTASVLTEAIGYIQFLHDQIQTLSVPYMKPSHIKSARNLLLRSKEESGRESKRDLRSRGICLVPLSYASHVNGFA